jgi:hypothetical protein
MPSLTALKRFNLKLMALEKLAVHTSSIHIISTIVANTRK